MTKCFRPYAESEKECQMRSLMTETAAMNVISSERLTPMLVVKNNFPLPG